MAGPWPVRLADAAEADFRAILAWTAERFGPSRATFHAETLAEALAALEDGPDSLGVERRDEIAPGLRTLHVARSGRRGRHFILFRVGRQDRAATIDVLRILHDAMDLRRHLPPDSLEDGMSTD